MSTPKKQKKPAAGTPGNPLPVIPEAVLEQLRISAHRDRPFRHRDRAFRSNVTGHFGIVTARFGPT